MKSSKKLLFGKTLLIAFVGMVVIIFLIVYFTGRFSHRSILENSFISLSIFAISFFIFLVFGLFNGLNVFDNYSHKLQLRWRNALKKDYSDGSWLPDLGKIETPDLEDGIGGIIGGVLLWILVSILFVFLLVYLQAIVWLTMIVLVSAIYWILIRALKLIFNKSKVCEGDFLKSVSYSAGYTLLYVGWIYGLVYLTTFF